MLLAVAAAIHLAASPHALVEVHGKQFVIAIEAESAGRIQIPLPQEYRAQVPAGFQLKIKPKVAARSQSVSRKSTGDCVLEVVFNDLKKGQRVDLEWRSQVIVDLRESFASVPKTCAFPQEFPEEARPWLRPSAFVQSDDKRIIAKAQAFRNDDLIETIRQTMVGLTSIYRGVRGDYALDAAAVTALSKPVACTGKANLLAALLRANGIPARVLSGFPTWSGQPFLTHYIVEAYVPGYGWYPLEPTLTALGWSCANMPIASIVTIESENRGFQRLSGAAGVPYLSLPETSGNIIARGSLTKDFANQEAKILGTIDSSELDPAKTRWRQWVSSPDGELPDLAPPSFSKG